MRYDFKHYAYIAVDRLTDEVVGRSNNFPRLCRRFPEDRYEIICKFNTL